MGTIASALYLVSPLAVAGHPTDEPVRAFSYQTAAIFIDVTRLNDKLNRTYIVFDAPVISRQRAPVLDEIVRQEVANNIKDNSNSNVSADLRSPVDDVTTVAVVDLASAVVADHERRVIALTQRLKDLQSIASQSASIQEVRGRLRRAVAAQKLAAARLAVANMKQNDCSLLGNLLCKSYSRQIVLQRSSLPISGNIQARRQTLATSTIQTFANEMRTARSAPVDGTEPRSTSERYPSSSSPARRLLDIARDRISDLPRGRSGPEIQIAGLLNFPGSDTWSLPDRTARA